MTDREQSQRAKEKTAQALLEAIAKFNYFDSKDNSFNFNSINDYPRGLLKKYQQEWVCSFF